MSVEDIFDYAERLPGWLQPAYFGTVFILFLLFARFGGPVGAVIVTAIGTLTFGWRGLFVVPGLTLLVIPGGAAGGLAFSALRFLRRVPLIGMWIRCTAAVMAYLSITIAIIAVLDPDGDTKSFSFITLAVSALFGGVLAFIWRDWPDQTDALLAVPSKETPADQQLADAVAADLADIRSWAAKKERWKKHLEAIETHRASVEYVEHWKRVVRRLTPWGGRWGAARQRKLAWREARRQLAAEQKRFMATPTFMA